MKKDIKNLFKRKGTRPIKRLGQNFLISKRVLEKIIAASQLKKTDVVLEIGPGIGILTKELALRVKKVIVIEKDPKMVKILKEMLECWNIRNVEIIQEDILKVKNSKLKIQNYKLVANLPYYITAPVIRKFLESPQPPKLMVLMVQKEVGQRICSRPPKMSKLAVFCQFYGKPEIASSVSKKSFWPQPKVDSAILKIVPHQFHAPGLRLSSAQYLLPQFRERFARIVKAGFSHPRKQLINNFSQGLSLSRQTVEKWLMKNNIESRQRAESLSLDDWLNLVRMFRN